MLNKTIGTKFISLLLLAMTISISLVVYNAIKLFNQDNLNNIYFATDLITYGKSKEIKSYLNEITQKSVLIGNILKLQSKNESKGHDLNALLTPFKENSDILSIKLLKEEITDPLFFTVKKHWNNLNEKDKDFKKLSEIIAAEKMPINDDIPNRPTFNKNDSFYIILLPFGEQSNQRSFLSVYIKKNFMDVFFEDLGVYELYIVNKMGKIFKTTQNDINLKSFKDNPLIQKITKNSLSREFQEYQVDGVDVLGSYSKLGIYDLAVLGQVKKDVAFETGERLARRSLLITALVLALSFIVAYLFIQKIIGPLEQLNLAAIKISKGDFDVHLDIKTNDEIKTLATSFNLMIKNIKHKIESLDKLNKSSHAISSDLNIKSLMDNSLHAFLEILTIDSGAMIIGEEKDHFELTNNIYYKGWDQDPIEKDKELLHEVLKQNTTTSLQFHQYNLFIIPILSGHQKVGTIILSPQSKDRMMKDEEIYISETIANSIAFTYVNIELLKETADKARMEKELETAKLVQDTMFPHPDIHFPSLAISSYYTPASECGGDWWGIIPIGEDKIMFAIADATGHGVPAALITAASKAAFTMIEIMAKRGPEQMSSPGEMLSHLNQVIFESSRGNVLMTFFLGIIDKKSGQVDFASASHDPIYWYDMPEINSRGEKGLKDNLRVLDCKPGPRLGQSHHAEYEQESVTIKPEDHIILYTDGIPEGKSLGADNEYGERKFFRSIIRHAHKGPDQLKEGIMDDFNKFITDEPLHDDVTLVVINYEGQSEEC